MHLCTSQTGPGLYKEVKFSGKAQKRPLDLLKALISFGGRGIPINKLADTLWPDADGDSAYQSLTMALRRLRKIIGKKKAITLSEGKLTLDSKYCWTDVWAFEQFLTEIQKDPIKLEMAIDLYDGPFLKNEIDAGWAIPMQTRLNQIFINAIISLAKYRQDEGDLQKAIEYYERGIEADNLSEVLYQHLMRCYDLMRQPTQVIKAYQSCRKILKSHYGVEPSETTTLLYQKLIESTPSSSN